MSEDELRYRNGQLRELVYSAESPIHGTGLFANRPIEKGDYIGTYWGPEASRNGMYVLWIYHVDRKDEAIGRSGRNLLRYLNHSASCNAEFDDFDLYAMVDIQRGQEITIDYGEDYS